MDLPQPLPARIAERHGRRAEWLASPHLFCRGFQILDRRFKAGGGEIDLVARRGGLLVLAEVKARRTLDDAIFAVTTRTRRRVEAAGRILVARRPHLAPLARRYDIIAVAGLQIRHIRAPGAKRISNAALLRPAKRGND